MVTSAEAVALAEFPELGRLVILRDAGWAFLPDLDDEGRVAEVRGVRAWPGSDNADAVLVRFTTDAAGLRCDGVGGVVWRREGTLTEVVDGLLALPSPGTRGAPRLVKATVPRLWTP
ncbi:hypothetical protein [Amycolatopsis sp. NPDC059021]|uniref:hypothetical protein n=1 Tax=Amycolatopsis sp. NPDC059021 TaxID=3346704 RepID=UPI00366A8E26